jgi:hypothetical protein
MTSKETSSREKEDVRMKRTKLSILAIGILLLSVCVALTITRLTEQQTYALSVNISPSGAGSVSPLSGEYEPNVQVTLTATPASGYTFDYWDGGASGSSATITIIMDSDKTVIAHFSVVDIAAPVISGVGISNITETSAAITWITDEPATSQIEYGKNTSYGSNSPSHEDLVTSHNVTLGDLEPNTVYHYRVKTRDSSNNLATSTDYTFTTLFLPNANDKDRYATILRLIDSKGNCEFHSEYNGREPTYTGSNFYRPVKVGESITIRVDVYNEVASPVLYEFIGEGFPNIEQTENEATFEVTDRLQTVHLRVFVKNSDEQYRAPYYDDMIQISYKIESS